jgi:hypothetical protein
VSRETVELVRLGFEAFNAGGSEAFATSGLIAEDIDAFIQEDMPNGGHP